MTAPALRFAARQRHIDGAEFVDGEGLTDWLHSAKSPQQVRQLFLRHAEDFDVQIGRVAPEQLIADEPADDQRAAAVVADQTRDVGRLRDQGRRHSSFWRTVRHSCETRATVKGRRWKLIVPITIVLATPLWLPLTCPLQPFFTTADKRALIDLKNRVAQPSTMDFDSGATLEALLAPGPDERRWSTAHAVAIEAYVVAVQSGGIELANCLSFTRRDIHIDLGVSANAVPRQRLVAEVTPPMRDAVRARGIDWSVAALERFIGRRVRVEGWLLFDHEHDRESENSQPGQPGNWRATAWEVHPVTSIELLE